MIKDITLGQYYDSASVLHRLDPRVKITGTLLFIVELFLVKSFLGFAICGAVILATVAISKVPLVYILRGMKPILLILIFTFALNIFMTPGRILWQYGFLKVTEEGLYTAAFMAIRLMLLIIASSLLTFTTKPVELTDGLEKLMKPASKLGFPAHDVAMMMSIALRFIPVLTDETDKIMKAQKARGADFESGNIITRAKALIPVLVPLFVSAFRIATDLAMAMEARCYRGGENRTRMNEMKLKGKDVAVIILNTLFFAGIIILRRFT